MKTNSSPCNAWIIQSLRVLALILLLPHLVVAQQRSHRDIEVKIKVESGKYINLYNESYALVIGVSDYTNGWPVLPGVKTDVVAVRDALEKQGFQVTVVMNPNGVQLDNAVRKFIHLHGLNINNRLLFYFAGHGHTMKQSYDEEVGYIVPADAPRPERDRAGFLSKAIDMPMMEQYARMIQAKHALFLFDSCFSGSLLFALSRAIPDSISYKTTRPVRQFITSGSADEEVPDESVFRRQFIEAIESEADSNKDGYVTGSELGEFLQVRVINYSHNKQHPQYGKIRNPYLDKGDFVFALPKAVNPQVTSINEVNQPASIASAPAPRIESTAGRDGLPDCVAPEPDLFPVNTPRDYVDLLMNSKLSEAYKSKYKNEDSKIIADLDYLPFRNSNKGKISEIKDKRKVYVFRDYLTSISYVNRCNSRESLALWQKNITEELKKSGFEIVSAEEQADFFVVYGGVWPLSQYDLSSSNQYMNVIVRGTKRSDGLYNARSVWRGNAYGDDSYDRSVLITGEFIKALNKARNKK